MSRAIIEVRFSINLYQRRLVLLCFEVEFGLPIQLLADAVVDWDIQLDLERWIAVPRLPFGAAGPAVPAPVLRRVPDVELGHPELD
jgi:hypothetical protein